MQWRYDPALSPQTAQLVLEVVIVRRLFLTISPLLIQIQLSRLQTCDVLGYARLTGPTQPQTFSEKVTLMQGGTLDSLEVPS